MGTLGRCRLVFLLDSEFAGRRSLTGPGPMYCPTASRKASGRPDAVSQFASPSVCGARGPGRLGARASEEGGSGWFEQFLCFCFTISVSHWGSA